MTADAVEAVEVETGQTSYRALFALPSIRRIVFGMALGRLASSMVSVAVILFSLTLYQSPVLTGIVTFASIFPGTVASPLAGALLDRYGRTRMVILDYLLAAASLILIAVLAAFDSLPPWALVLIVGISSIAHPLSNSGLRTLFPIIVPRHLWTRVNAVDSNTWVVSQLIGPPVAGAAIQFLGPIVGLVVVGSVYWPGRAGHARDRGAAVRAGGDRAPDERCPGRRRVCVAEPDAAGPGDLDVDAPGRAAASRPS